MAKKIAVLAPFFGAEDNRWISDFCSRSDFEFTKIPNSKRLTSWHQRGTHTPLSEWTNHLKYARKGIQPSADCIVTCFPQLTLVTAALLLLYREHPKLVAWHFNLGSVPSGWRRFSSAAVLRRVDRFVVHSTHEVETYSQWLNCCPDKFRFVPLQRGKIPPAQRSPIQRPYIVSMGSANRDYEILVRATIGSGIRTVIVSKQSITDALPSHPDLIKLHGLSWDECEAILKEAEINVVPIAATQTAAGQVSFTTSMRMGIPTIATACVATTDYIQNEKTGVLVPPGDSFALREAITRLWHDAALKTSIGTAAQDYAERHFSDEAAGRYLANILEGVFQS